MKRVYDCDVIMPYSTRLIVNNSEWELDSKFDVYDNIHETEGDKKML